MWAILLGMKDSGSVAPGSFCAFWSDVYERCIRRESANRGARGRGSRKEFEAVP